MNNPDEFNEVRPFPASAWADLVERLGQVSKNDQVSSPNQIAASDLCSADIDDLELDGQLQMLGRIKSGSDQFVDSVMMEVNNEPSRDSQTSSKLPVPTPDLNLTSDDEFLNHVLVNHQATRTADRPEQISSKGVNVSKLLLVTGVLGLSVFITVMTFNGSSNHTDQIIDSKTVLIEKGHQPEATDLADDLNPVDRGKLAISIDESKRIQNEFADSNADNQPKSIDDILIGSTNVGPRSGPIAKNENANRVDAKPEKIVQRPRNNEPNELIPTPIVKPIPDVELDWRLAINFNSSGVGEIKLNEKKITAFVIQDNARLLLFDVASEIERRFSFLEPALGKRLKGVVSIEQTNFYFNDSARLSEVMEHACTQINGLEFKYFNYHVVQRLRAKYLAIQERDSRIRELVRTKQALSERMAKGRSTAIVAEFARVSKLIAEENKSLDRDETQIEFESINLVDRQGAFYYSNERDVVYEIVGRTEQILQQMAIDRIERLTSDSIKDPFGTSERLNREKSLYGNSDNSIGTTAFHNFAESGMLDLPTPEDSFAIATSIQKLGPIQLREQLNEQTASLDLFRNLEEFKSAENLVFKNGKALLSEVNQLEKKRSILVRKLRRAEESKNNDSVQQIISDIASSDLASRRAQAKSQEPLAQLLSKRPDLDGLPLVMGEQCHLDSNSAETLNDVSIIIGEAVSRFDFFGSRDIAQNDVWRYSLLKKEIKKCFSRGRLHVRIGQDSSRNHERFKSLEQGLMTLNQILQIDHPRLRWELVEMLGRNESPVGIEMLVDRAKYDFSPEIRNSATKALGGYSSIKFRDQLLDGLKYPWYVVAQHSAEALVRLNDQEAVSELVEMLNLPDPRLPEKVDEDRYIQRELIAVNHMRNCLLCHAPSRTTSDPGRGLSPSWDKPIPVAYYHGSKGAFVRADVTYLRQDFSVLQPVENNGPWPKEQRFDYLVQNKKLNTRLATQAIGDISKQRNLNRESIVYALRELTGQRPANDSYETWKAILKKRKVKAKLDEKRS